MFVQVLNSGELNSGELNSGELKPGELNSGELKSGELNSGALAVGVCNHSKWPPGGAGAPVDDQSWFLFQIWASAAAAAAAFRCV